jgi:hypothetical protein
MKRLSTIRLADETYQVIDVYAKKREMTVLGFIRYILDNWAKRHSRKTST